MSMVFHSLLKILLMSPVRIIWFAAEIWGLRLRAKIMNAFMGRLGVPSALSVWDVSAWYGSSAQRDGGEAAGARGGSYACPSPSRRPRRARRPLRPPARHQGPSARA